MASGPEILTTMIGEGLMIVTGDGNGMHWVCINVLNRRLGRLAAGLLLRHLADYSRHLVGYSRL